MGITQGLAIPELKGVLHELGGGGDAELLLDVLTVGIDGAGTDLELLGDLAGFETPADELQDVNLTIGKEIGGLGGSVAAEEDLGFEVEAAAQYAAEAGEDLGGGLELGDIAERAGPPAAGGVERLVLHGDDEDLESGPGCEKVFDEGDAVFAAEKEVGEEEVGRLALEVLEDGGGRSGLAADLEIGLGIEGGDEAITHDGMVVGHKDAMFSHEMDAGPG